MRPPRVAHSPKVDIVLLNQCGISEVRALLAPLVKLSCAVVGRNELPVMQRGQAAWLAEWQRAQQQCVDDAEDTRVYANADGKGGNRETGVPRTASPKPKRVPDILRHFARNLRRNRYGQIGQEANPKRYKSAGPARFSEFVAKFPLHRRGIVRKKPGRVES